VLFRCLFSGLLLSSSSLSLCSNIIIFDSYQTDKTCRSFGYVITTKIEIGVTLHP
jgi:hypothetical protein